MRFLLARDGSELYVKDWGAGRPVVLIHGWPLSSDTFDDMAMAIAERGLRAIAYDRRGFGRSEQPWAGYDYDTLSDDLAAVIEATEANDATLVGFSMGGGEVARYMSRHHGAHVAQAVLISSVVPYLLKTTDNPHGVDASVFKTMGAAIRDDRAAFWPTFFKQFYGIGMVAQPVAADVVSWSCALAMRASLKATLACVEAFGTTDFRRDLPYFTVPTLLIHGTADKTVPIDTTARRAAEAISGSRLVEYAGAPHGLLASHKERVIQDVLAFLDTVPHRNRSAAALGVAARRRG